MTLKRLNLTVGIFLVFVGLIIARLFYWQVISAEELAAIGESQHISKVEIPSKRGEIRTADGFPLAANQETFLIFAYLPQLEQSSSEIVDQLIPIIGNKIIEKDATSSAEKRAVLNLKAREVLKEKLDKDSVSWVPLVNNADITEKKAVEALDISGIGIEPSFTRDYPEASMAANILGFVGRDTAGNPKGYFGLEGYYDLELRGRSGMLRQEKDATGKPILIGRYNELEVKEGRHLVLHIDRAIQKNVEEKLNRWAEKIRSKEWRSSHYGAQNWKGNRNSLITRISSREFQRL